MSWDLTGNISFLSNEVTGLNKTVYLTGTAQGQGFTSTWCEIIANNQPMNEFFGYRIDTIDKNGRIVYLKNKIKNLY